MNFESLADKTIALTNSDSTRQLVQSAKIEFNILKKQEYLIKAIQDFVRRDGKNAQEIVFICKLLTLLPTNNDNSILNTLLSTCTFLLKSPSIATLYLVNFTVREFLKVTIDSKLD